MPTEWRDRLNQIVDDLFPEIVEVRRHLHAHPEPSGAESATTLYLYQRLDRRQLRLRMGPDGYGVLADIDDPRATARYAVRGDIDALRIHDAKQVAYRSQCDGVMHACGHDAHAAVVYGVLSALKQATDTDGLPWPVAARGVLQPAEETCDGAKRMIDAGAVEDVEGIVSLHMDPTRRVGQIGLREGVFTANCDEMEIRLRGRGGHAARPHEASDPIAAAAQLVAALYLFIPRVTDSQDAVVVTIGSIQGGDNANVIPEEVTLRGTIRSLDATVRRQTLEHVRRLAAGVANTTDTRIEVHFGLGCNSVINDSGLISVLRRSGREVLGDAGLQEITRASMGSEDFAFYGERVPSAMIRIGCTSERAGGAGLHTPTFDIDEECLRGAVKVLSQALVYLTDPDRPPRKLASQAVGAE